VRRLGAALGLGAAERAELLLAARANVPVVECACARRRLNTLAPQTSGRRVQPLEDTVPVLSRIVVL
jgi:hypothetical protein